MRKFWESIYCPNYITGYNPFLLKDMNKAIERLSTAINNREKIVVCGTGTVDGICGMASLSLVLKYLNADVEYVIHDESSSNGGVDEGDILNNIHFLGAKLLITLGVDLACEKDVELCESLGIDLIVLENKKTTRQRNYIYINPSQKSCQYRYKNISTSVLSFKLMQAVAIYYNMKSINKYIDLILLGAQWAGFSQKGENGVILKEGRKFLINTNNIGLKAIIAHEEMNKLEEEEIANIIELITPPKTTVGQMNNARIVLELLTTTDEDRASQIAKYLNNIKRSN
ncbi:MAG: DHH family phosphoesterase [Clostridium sp.]